MSIRPVDYTSLIPKSQEVAKVRQLENNKFNNQIEIGFAQQQKQIKENQKKVRDTNKTENLTIDANKRNNKEKGKKKKKDKKNKNEETLGGNIDIRI